MAVNVDDVVRITAVMTDSTEGQVQNVYWCKMLTVGATNTQFMTSAANRLEALYAVLVPYQPDQLSYTEVRGFNMTQSEPLITTSWPTLTAGTVDVADPMPAPCSGLIFGRSEGNRAVGRKYLGPFTEADHADGLWLGGLDTALAAFAAGWPISFVMSSGGNAMFGVYNVELSVWRPMIEMVTRLVVAYQRRRRKGRGV